MIYIQEVQDSSVRTVEFGSWEAGPLSYEKSRK